MPLDAYEDYERLNEHLAGLDTPLAEFARRYGYQLTPRMKAGLYPRANLRREGIITLFIQLSMDLDSADIRFDHFFPDIPYSVLGTAWVDDRATLTRWRSTDLRLDGVPFRTLAQTLELQLSHFHGYLAGLSEEHIKASGRTIRLSPEADADQHPPPPDTDAA